MLDRTQQRILGVLMEKELAVPDSYPMTENALLAGCNQKSNRDPEMSLEGFEVSGALMAMCEKEWVTRIDGGRASRFRHEADKKIALDPKEKAIIAELLVRGPQAPGALKARVARMGFNGTPHDIEAVLRGLRDRSGRALVEQQARRPRERDQRWAHCLGPHDEAQAESPETPDIAPTPSPRAVAEPPPPAAPTADLELRLAELESEIGTLREEVAELRERLDGLTTG